MGDVIARLRPIWKDALPMLFALGDGRTPLPAKLLAGAALAYAVLPLDFLPDVTPVLGLADDVLIVPTLLALAARALPAPVLQDARWRSGKVQQRLPWLIPAVIGAALLGLTLLGWGVWKLAQG
ncbi:hypothetical protein Dxin01_01828 [Deinococcus xinjiangensis]|uniref:DUF1232 domain-containing protein n=1 Tax=Deinococcus xinjiangensis TaxID=457454 RepID=A0ABP9V9Y9_9DEIO